MQSFKKMSRAFNLFDTILWVYSNKQIGGMNAKKKLKK